MVILLLQKVNLIKYLKDNSKLVWLLYYQEILHMYKFTTRHFKLLQVQLKTIMY